MFADLPLIVLSLSGLAYLVLWAAVIRDRGVRGATARMLSAYLLLSAGWAALQALLRLQQLALLRGFDIFTLERLALYCLGLLAVILFQLTRRFERRAAPGWGGWAAGAGLLGLAALLYENPLGLPDLLPAGGRQVDRVLAAYAVILAAWFGFMGGAVLVTAHSLSRRVSPLHRNRNTYWLLAAVLAAAGQALFLARQAAPASLLLVLAAGAAVYTQLNFNLPDLRVLRRRAVRFVVMAALAMAAYTGGYLAIQAAARATPGLPPAAAGAALAALLILLFNPLLNAVQGLVNRLAGGLRYDARQTLSKYSTNVSNILDLQRLAATAVGLVGEAIGVSSGALATAERQPGDDFWDDAGGAYLVRSISAGGKALPEGRLSASNPAVEYLRREHQPLLQYDIDLLPRFRAMDPAERAWFDSLGMDVYVPIFAQERWIGLLALGPKQSGDRYFPEDLALLQTLADQTAVALENARLYDHLKQRNAENERLNAELKAANVELARLDRAKSDFINIASHELRTPLTQVIGYNDILSEMLKTGDLPPETGIQMVGNVRKAARRLEEVVDSMFDISNLEARTLSLARSPVTLAAIVSVAIDTWTSGLNDRQQTIAVRGVSGLPGLVADPKRLTQVFSHLIQNAIKSTPDGGKITLSGRLVEGDGEPEGAGARQYIEVVVSDTGVGIDPDDLERIFEKFYRVGNVLLHSTGDTKFMGAGPGLGLTIARGIVEAHGGRLWAESPGHDEQTFPGASFHVLLPVKPEA